MILTQIYDHLLSIYWTCTKVSILNGIFDSKTNFSKDVLDKKIQLRLDKEIFIIARCVNLCSTMAKGQG